MSKLRDHIADVLAHHPTFNLKDDGYSAEDVLRMADVLIRELGWRRQVDDKATFRMEPSRYRYVTDWTVGE